jgi:hypothetical protein
MFRSKVDLLLPDRETHSSELEDDAGEGTKVRPRMSSVVSSREWAQDGFPVIFALWRD